MKEMKAIMLLALVLSVALAMFFQIWPNTKASTGHMLVGVTMSPSPVVNVRAGENVSIYFGSVSFSGGQFYLLWSVDGFSSISPGDFKFSPVFNTVDLQGSKKLSDGVYVGNDWVNLSVPTTTAGGHYYIKCFDGASTSVAVTDNYVNLLPIIEITPFTRGAGGASISIKGSAFTSNGVVKLTYYDPVVAVNKTLATVSTDAKGRFIYATTTPDLEQWLPAGEHPITFDTIKFYGNDTSTGYQAGAYYLEGRRGLLQVDGVYPITGNMFGNGTIFSVEVHVGDRLRIVGDYFRPPAVAIYFDDIAVGTVKTNSSGFFNTTVKIPPTTAGSHQVTIEDSVVDQTTTTMTVTTTTTNTTTTSTATTTSATTISNTTTVPTSTTTSSATTTTTKTSSATVTTTTETTTATKPATTISSASTTSTPSQTTSSPSTTSYSTPPTTSPASPGTEMLAQLVLGSLAILILGVAVALLLRDRRGRR
jgi:hypothetical protein